MGLKKYCFCYEIGVGGTLIGFLQLNAMLFFWSRFAELEPYYCWLDLGVSACYTVRVVFFFIIIGMDYTLESRRNYFEAQKYSTFVLCALGIAITVCKWVEYGHFALWQFVSWTLVGGFNAYHWFVIKEWAEISGNSWAPYEDPVDTSSLVKDTGVKNDDGVEMNDMFDGFNILNKNNKVE